MFDYRVRHVRAYAYVYERADAETRSWAGHKYATCNSCSRDSAYVGVTPRCLSAVVNDATSCSSAFG